MIVSDLLQAIPGFTYGLAATTLAAVAALAGFNTRLKPKARVLTTALLLALAVTMSYASYRAEIRAFRFNADVHTRFVQATLKNRIFILENTTLLPPGDECLSTLPPDQGGCAGMSGDDYQAWHAGRVARLKTMLADIEQARERALQLHPGLWRD